MGHTRNGQVYAFPEEALFLLDRGSLMVQHGGVDVTVQQMWALYFESERITSAATSSSTSSAMDRYQVYAYLKRLGFIVTRPGIYDQTRRSASTTTTTTIPSASASVSGATVLTHRYSFWDGWTLMSQFIWKRASSLFHLSIGRLSAWATFFSPSGSFHPRDSQVTQQDGLTTALKDLISP
ncbi:tRNA splicing endonuclease 54 [Actinomortierella ambigua]|uniref:tRNA splicing endonuclease 54 n=1 Tax=Actinomortierella ambigua TaxID=1343610 RepID=A0A9P6QCZ0_9FUNG|nr:tRNA splicing endonuclease 54 [Actinomortierella ambigua]